MRYLLITLILLGCVPDEHYYNDAGTTIVIMSDTDTETDTDYIPADGQDGADGIDGQAGANGANGHNGTDGEAGEQGQTGAPGVDGSDGQDGLDGANGDAGPQGVQGPQGATGAQGPQGARGPAGAGTRVVYSGVLDSGGNADITTGVLETDMAVIQVWCYDDTTNSRMFGAGWYDCAYALMPSGILKIHFSGGSGADYQVVVVR